MNLNEEKSKAILSNEGINVIPGKVVTTANDARRYGNQIGFPVVLKVVSDDIIHKSDVGGVILNINENNIKSSFTKIINHVHKKMPQAKIEGVYVQKMAKPGIECIIGLKQDKQFGHVIIFGLGGIYAEVYKDISMRILPITEKDAHEMILETKISKVLMGARGKTYDVNTITDTIIKVSQIADKYNIVELDINPLIVFEDSIVIVDARIKL